LLGVAKYSDGQRAEKDIALSVFVLDENDCPPVFQINQIGSVNESSAAGNGVPPRPSISPYSRLCVAYIEHITIHQFFFLID